MSKPTLELTVWDRLISFFSPAAGLRRLQARAAAGILTRGYDAATPSRRTNSWKKQRGDINAITAFAGAELRIQARDLVRNNSWAKRGQRVIANNTVGWGIVPKPTAVTASGEPDQKVNDEAARLWKLWADTTECDADESATFYGLQHQVMKALATDGEALIRRRYRRSTDTGASGEVLPVPLQLQVLEADFLDTAKDEVRTSGAKIVQGVEFDLLGRRAAYWLFPEHPGSSTQTGLESRRVPASDVAHIFYRERAGQARGVSWFGSAIVNLRDFDEFEDAELMRQKIAACFAGIVEDQDGVADPIGAADTATPADETIETIEPGQIQYLKPGQKISFATPPGTTTDGFTVRQLRRVAAGLGITYEDLTGDYSNVNFSSARMGQLAHRGNLKDWQWNMLIPQFCAAVWRWFVAAAAQAGKLPAGVGAEWTVPPLPMINPAEEVLAISRQVRNGITTPSEMVREQGGDPAAHFEEYAADMKRLKALGVVLDSDPSTMTQSGQAQSDGSSGGGGFGGFGKKKEEPAEPAEDEEEKPKKEGRTALVDLRIRGVFDAGFLKALMGGTQ